MALQNLLFLAVLALLPVQLNKFLFIESSYVFGIPIDYRALSLYLSDIAIILFTAAFATDNFQNLKKIFHTNRNLYTSLILFNLFAIANNLFREGFPIPFYFSLRVFIFSVFFIAAVQTISRRNLNKYIYPVILISLLWQSVLIIFQFLNQHSLGFWFLGERSFDASTVSIAHVDIFGFQFLRSYGTFPHPNLTGAFLTLTLIFSFLEHFSKNSLKYQTLKKASVIILSENTAGFIPRMKRILSEDQRTTAFRLLFSISAIALLLTFSRSALTVFSLLILILSKNLKSLILKSGAFLAIVILLLPLLITTQLASVAERLTLTQASLDITANNLLTGVGNTNFLTQLAKLDLTSLSQTRLIQPVHNVFLLILSENGILGFAIFIIFLFFVSQKARSKTKIMLFVAILIFASADHFLWTLHQGQMLFWLSLAFIVSKPSRT